MAKEKKEQEIIEEETAKKKEDIKTSKEKLFYNFALSSMIQGIAGLEAALFILGALDSMTGESIFTILMLLVFLNLASGITFGVLGLIKGHAKAKAITGLVLAGVTLLVVFGILAIAS